MINVSKLKISLRFLANEIFQLMFIYNIGLSVINVYCFIGFLMVLIRSDSIYDRTFDQELSRIYYIYWVTKVGKCLHISFIQPKLIFEARDHVNQFSLIIEILTSNKRLLHDSAKFIFYVIFQTFLSVVKCGTRYSI